MSKKERQDFVKIIEKYREKLSKDKQASRKFLVDIGIFTKKGNLRQPYKHLCIRQGQD